MLIHLPKHLKSFVEREVASGRYANENDVIEDALVRLADESGPTMTVAEAVAESLAQAERGEVVELTPDYLDRAMQRARENAHRGHKVRDDVKY